MRALIVSGGDIDYDLLKFYCNSEEEQVIIAVDRGLRYLYDLNILPNHIVGDFDSADFDLIECYRNNTNIQIHKYFSEKDYTDTDIALNLAISLSVHSITILGALGKRMDHALGNIHILAKALSYNIFCEIVDIHNRIYVIDKSIALEKEKVYGKYVSLIPLTSFVYGLTLNGFKYIVNDYKLSIGKSLGISNEIIENFASIELKKGILIVIESKD